MDDCPDDDLLARHVEGRATPAEAERLRAHLEGCASCRRLTAELLRSAVAATPFPVADADAEAETEPRLPLVRGTRVGRYEVQGIIGAGAMGIVYAARDPDLDREVALKLIHPEASAEDAELLRERLIREARAMAKLVHPNVVAIHDVGASGDGVFIAMDLVHGRDVRAWLAESPRGWRQVLDVFLQAGRGLAAAHAAGLVHRDFKPDNVLVAEDGRVCVTDFGLARLGGGEAEGAPGDAGADADPAPAERLTLTGMVLGTPAYMAPEQRAGIADARSDIFAYSVALWESIHGEHPFPLEDRARLQDAMLAGRVKEPPAGTRVPRFVRRALLGGLAPDPEARTQTMERLLGALGRDRRRTFLAAAGVAGVLLAGAAAIAGRGGPPAASPCHGGERRWAGAWGPDRAAAMRGAFVATGKPYAADSASRAERLLEAYGRRWNEAYVDACEATRVRGDQSEALLDRRMACLDDRLRDVAALGQTFLAADASVVAKAVEATDALPPLRSCADPARLLALTPPPEGREAAAHLEEARRLAARARALRTAGRVAECVDAAAAAVTAARASGYAPLQAETLLELGLAQAAKGQYPDAARSYRDAAAAAITGHDEVTSARAHSQLVKALSRSRRTEEGLTMAELARAQVARAGGDPSLWVELLVARGHLYRQGDRYAAALGDHLLALMLFERANGGDHPQMGDLLQNVSMDLGMMHRFGEELTFASRSLAVLERTIGPQHPATGLATSRYALGLLGAGRIREALTFSELGLARQEAALGPDHPYVAQALGVRGDVLAEAGHWREAAAVYARGLATEERGVGPEHDELVPFLMQGAKVLAHVGRDAEAAAWIARARAIAAKTQARASWTHYLRYTEAYTLELAGKDAAAAAAYAEAAAELEKAAPDSEEVGLALAGLARAEERHGRCREALRFYDRALAALSASSGPQNAVGMLVRADRASCLVELGEVGAARGEAGAIVAFAEASGDIPETAATARFVLARLEPDRAAARALAERALEGLTGDNARDREHRRQVERWLQRR